MFGPLIEQKFHPAAEAGVPPGWVEKLLFADGDALTVRKGWIDLTLGLNRLAAVVPFKLLG